jgi:predicted HTH transcriptional regulator
MEEKNMGDISLLWIFLIVVTCGFGAILYLLVTHDSEEMEEKEERVKVKPLAAKVTEVKDLTERQKKILTYMTEKKMAKPPELRKIAGDVSTRTVRRDMNILIEKGLVSQEGSTKATYYRYLGE